MTEPRRPAGMITLSSMPWIPGKPYASHPALNHEVTSLGVNLVAGEQTFYPLPPGKLVTIIEAGVFVGTLDAGKNCRIGIYSAHPTTLQADSRLFQTANISLGATGKASDAAISWKLPPNAMHWLSIKSDSTALLYRANVAIFALPAETWGALPTTQYISNTTTFAADPMPATAPALTSETIPSQLAVMLKA